MLMKQTFKTKYIKHICGTLTSLKRVQFRYVTPQNYQDWVSLCFQNQNLLKLVGKSIWSIRYEKHIIDCDKMWCVYKTYFSRPLIAQDKLFHRQNAVRNFLIPST